MTEGRGRLFTRDEVLDAARAVVAEWGRDHVVRGLDCVYSNEEGRPVCLVGHVVHRLGLPFPPGGNYRVPLPGPSLLTCPPVRRHYWENLFTPDALAALRVMQTFQDAGQTWGRALYRAENGADAPEDREV